jgi:hypothetical protein
MLLEDKFADVKLLHDDGESFEIWWFYEDSILAVSHCPNNYPSTAVFTMSTTEAIEGLNKLLSEGWRIERESELFLETRESNS